MIAQPRARRSHVIDPTGLKVFGEGEWKVRKHGQQKRRVWRKLHLSVAPSTHEVVSAAVSLNLVSDSQVLPELLSSSCCDEIKQVSADGAYDARDCYEPPHSAFTSARQSRQDFMAMNA